MRFATFCRLLVVALMATAALAQTHPTVQPSREPATVQKAGRTRQQLAEEAFIQNTYEGLNHAHEIARHTQPATADPSRVYSYVEHMPTLNGQSGFAGIAAAIQQQLVLPLAAPAGRVLVQFIVTKEGMVSQPQIVKGLRADVVAATRQLPRFAPGNQNVKSVGANAGSLLPAGLAQWSIKPAVPSAETTKSSLHSSILPESACRR